jgi:hypothetical protein
VGELTGDFLPQPASKMVAAITPIMIPFFISCHAISTTSGTRGG